MSPEDYPEDLGGPLFMIVDRKKTGTPSFHRVRLFAAYGIAVGCQWSPGREQWDTFDVLEHRGIVHRFCKTCWRDFALPGGVSLEPTESSDGAASDDTTDEEVQLEALTGAIS